jgi:hypothetical protein
VPASSHGGCQSQLLSPTQCLPPAYCSLLRPGVVFEGCQRLMQMGIRHREEQWGVTVKILVSAVWGAA